MGDQDHWGRDPSVRWMRSVFMAMERHQGRLLKQFAISRRDPRLRLWREQALVLFNGAWAGAGRRGIPMDDEKTGRLYAAGLFTILQREGMLPKDFRISFDADIEKLLKETGD